MVALAGRGFGALRAAVADRTVRLPHACRLVKAVPSIGLDGSPPPPLEARIADLGEAAALAAELGLNQHGAVEHAGLASNTIVVLLGDHGWHLGEHGLWHKGTLFEESARAPLVISTPGSKGNGRATARIVEFVDLFPTIAELCGVPAPAGLAGASLRPLLDDPSARRARPAFTQVTRPGNLMGRSIHTDRWRYTEWDSGRAGVELYDHGHDPHEMTNLARDRDYTSTIADLRHLLRANFAVQ
jgi:uncharacterized sulfatase